MLSNERELCLFDTASNAPARQLHSSASNIVVLGVRTNPSLRRTLIGIRSDDLDRALNSDCTHETVPKARQYDFVSTLGPALSDKRAMGIAAAALKAYLEHNEDSAVSAESSAQKLHSAAASSAATAVQQRRQEMQQQQQQHPKLLAERQRAQEHEKHDKKGTAA